MDEETKEEITSALIEAIWLMRWSDNKESMHAVLTTKEAELMVENIHKELDKSGYQIVKK